MNLSKFNYRETVTDQKCLLKGQARTRVAPWTIRINRFYFVTILRNMVQLMTGHNFPLQAKMDATKKYRTTGHKMNQERQFFTQCLKIKSVSGKEKSFLDHFVKEKKCRGHLSDFERTPTYMQICWLTRFGVPISYGLPVCWKHPFSCDGGAGR